MESTNVYKPTTTTETTPVGTTGVAHESGSAYYAGAPAGSGAVRTGLLGRIPFLGTKAPMGTMGSTAPGVVKSRGLPKVLVRLMSLLAVPIILAGSVLIIISLAWFLHNFSFLGFDRKTWDQWVIMGLATLWACIAWLMPPRNAGFIGITALLIAITWYYLVTYSHSVVDVCHLGRATAVYGPEAIGQHVCKWTVISMIGWALQWLGLASLLLIKSIPERNKTTVEYENNNEAV